MPWSRGWYHVVEFAGSQIIKVFWSWNPSSLKADSWAEKLSIRSATFRPSAFILLSNYKSHSLKISAVIQAFLLLRHIQPKFCILMPAVVKAFGLFAVLINQIGRHSDASELQQKSALILDFSFLHPGRVHEVRLLSGINLQYRLVSSQLKISWGAYILRACWISRHLNSCILS